MEVSILMCRLTKKMVASYMEFSNQETAKIRNFLTKQKVLFLSFKETKRMPLTLFFGKKARKMSLSGLLLGEMEDLDGISSVQPCATLLLTFQ